MTDQQQAALRALHHDLAALEDTVRLLGHGVEGLTSNKAAAWAVSSLEVIADRLGVLWKRIEEIGV